MGVGELGADAEAGGDTGDIIGFAGIVLVVVVAEVGMVRGVEEESGEGTDRNDEYGDGNIIGVGAFDGLRGDGVWTVR